MKDLSREQWERAQAAFYPFIDGFQLSLNPEDIDEIILAILTHVDSDASPEAIVDEVRAQIASYLESSRLRYAVPAAPRDASEASAAATPGWVVWRQDDHGNRAEVARHADRAGADAHVAELEGRGHKQIYWVARTDA